MPIWETMPPSFYVGVGAALLMVAATIVVPLLLRRLPSRSQPQTLSSHDRASAAEAHRLHELATAASMSATASALKQ